MKRKFRDYQEKLLEDLQDHELANLYLNEALNEEDPRAFLLALKNVHEACENITNIKKYILRIHIFFTNMPAYSKRKKILQPRFRRFMVTLHKKIVIIMFKYQIWNNLLVNRVLFHLRTGKKLLMLFNNFKIGITIGTL